MSGRAVFLVEKNVLGDEVKGVDGLKLSAHALNEGTYWPSSLSERLHLAQTRAVFLVLWNIKWTYVEHPHLAPPSYERRYFLIVFSRHWARGHICGWTIQLHFILAIGTQWGHSWSTNVLSMDLLEICSSIFKHCRLLLCEKAHPNLFHSLAQGDSANCTQMVCLDLTSFFFSRDAHIVPN